MKSIKHIIYCCMAIVFTTTAFAQDPKPEERFKFEAGYPTAEASEALYDEMDYQRAVQAYIWATPLLNSMGFRAGLEGYGVNEKNGKFIVFEQSLNPQQIAMTANQTTPYIWTLLDLKANGPMVVFVPPGEILGGFCDFWHRAIGDYGPVGPDRGKGGTYLVLPPNYDEKVPDGYFIIQSTSNLAWFFGRANNVKFKGEACFELFRQIRSYPLSKADKPPKPELVPVGLKPFNSDWPKGYEAWTLIHEGIQLDNIRQQDKIIYDFLKDLGIRHGEPFNPNERQKKILTRAAETGHKMVANLAFAVINRSDYAIWWPGNYWVSIFQVRTPLFETPTYAEVTDRACGWYQLVMNGTFPFMAKKTPINPKLYGLGSNYLANYHDNDRNFLNGSNAYRLRVPPNVPAANFWSVTVYNNQSRSMINNQQNRIGRGSTDNIKISEDGSVDLYFGPKLPGGAPESNWVQTNQGEGWFVLFRFYGPTKEFYDHSWKLPDFEKIK